MIAIDTKTHPLPPPQTHKFGNDKGSTLGALPEDDQLLSWAREKLNM